MARGLNKVLLIGNLGHDPEVRYTASGKAVTSFSLASNRSWVTSAGERKEATEWFRVVAWGNLAEICGRFLSKGSRVYIEGQLQTRSWDNQGQKHYTTEVVAKEMIILDAKDKEPEPEYDSEEWEAEPSESGTEPMSTKREF